MDHIQIAIDGPSGAGKSSISRAVAAALGLVYVDTGALYRTVGYYARSQGISLEDAAAVAQKLGDIRIEVKYMDGVQHVFLNGEDLGDRIRENEISLYAAAVAKVPAVREFLLDTQKRIADENHVIMDGRDIGTVILPRAQVKIFLTASNEARARRRVAELAEKGMPVSYETVLADMKLRDEQDRTRAVAPAVQAPDAILFDNSELTFEESVEGMIRLIREVLSGKGLSL